MARLLLNQLSFRPGEAEALLRTIPALPGIFALRGEDENAQPYLTRAADLRRRMTRLLAPPELSADGRPVESRRLNLRERVRTIEFTVTGSEFESLLALYDASAACFGHAEARRRLRLHTPYCLRLTIEHAHPRLYTTNRLGRRGLERTYGPFASRTAAERALDGVLDLFKLRRCWEDLVVHPGHPGCAYGEMHRCLSPCNTGCTPAEYAEEAGAVERFLETRGASLLAGIEQDRERASAAMEFEQAAALHRQYEKTKAAATLGGELVRPIPELRAIVVQAAARVDEQTADALEANVFLLAAGRLYGPERLSTLGVRAAKEQTSVGSSLFAQPLMLGAVPLEDGSPGTSPDSPELRCERALAGLAARVETPRDLLVVSDHLSLVRRWFYRPEKARTGEIFFPNEDGSWPVRRILRGAARAALGEPKAMAETDREGVAAAKTKILHEGREGVERVVPVIAKARRGARTRLKPSGVDALESEAAPAAPFRLNFPEEPPRD